MSRKTLAIVLSVLTAFGATTWGAYRYGAHHGTPVPAGAAGTGTSQASAGDMIDSATGRRVLYWHDPMVPGQKFDKPGKSPFMDMQLVPVFADERAGEGGVSVSPQVVQNLGVRTGEVMQGSLAHAIQVVGNVAYDERDQALIQARSGGFIERLHVRAPLDAVRQGQALVDILSPEWVAAQEEYLALRRMQAVDAESLRGAARQRMLLLGMTEEAIRKVEETGKVQATATYYATLGGVIAELGVREGMTVMPGATLFRINGLGRVWVNAEVPETQAASLRPGQTVEARAPAIANVIFKGRISALLPQVSQATRTVIARIELPNPSGRLSPGMFMTVNLTGSSRKGVLLVPSEAVIQTGRRSVVIVALDESRFQPVDVKIGAESQGQTEIVDGLKAGQRIVLSGQFLIDSEASLKGALARMGDAASPSPVAPNGEHIGEGMIESINDKFVTLSHDPMPALRWGAMTMEFELPKAGVPAGLKAGQRVRFALTLAKGPEPVLTRIEPLRSTAGAGNAKPKAAP